MFGINTPKLIHDVGDYIEAGLKLVGLGDETSATIATTSAAVMSDFVAKWAPQEKQLLLAGAKTFADTVLAGGNIVTAAGAMVAKFAIDSLVVTEQDAMDAIRVHLIAAA